MIPNLNGIKKRFFWAIVWTGGCLLSWEALAEGQFHGVSEKSLSESVRAAAAAYTPQEKVPLNTWEKEQGVQVEQWIIFATDAFGKKDEAGLVLLKTTSKKRTVVIAFLGTRSLAHALTDVRFIRTSAAPLGIKGLAHKGFFNRYLSLRGSLLSILKTHIVPLNCTSFQVTGHSMGGALATLAAYDIKQQMTAQLKKDVVVLLDTFCSPRVVDLAGAKAINAALGLHNIRRLWRSGDPVSAMPPGLGGRYYKHVGRPGGLKLRAPHFSSSGNDFKMFAGQIESFLNPTRPHTHTLTFQEHEDGRLFVTKKHQGVLGRWGLLKK
jgi:hypothetical protein